MAFSWQEESARAGQVKVNVTIAYLDKSDIFVELNDVNIEGFTWDSDTVISLPNTLDVEQGDKLAVIRRTAREHLWLLFSEGAAFTRDNLDEQNTQFLYLAQEMVEGRSIDGFFGDISMNGYRITDLGAPREDADATNKQYVDNADTLLQNAIDKLSQNWDASHEQAVFSWSTTVTEPTAVFKPPFEFRVASLFINGAAQNLGESYEVKNNTITVAEELPVGTQVMARLGGDIDVGDVGTQFIQKLQDMIDGLRDDLVTKQNVDDVVQESVKNALSDIDLDMGVL